METRRSNPLWGKVLLILSGLFWIGRTALEVVYHPQYWEPQSTIDYLAVAGTSLSLLTMAVGLWILLAHQRTVPSNSMWHYGMMLSGVSAAVVGVSNFLEDWFNVNALGFLFPVGMVALLLGLLFSGIGAMRARNFPRRIGWMLLLSAASLPFLISGGGFLLGLALIILSSTL